MIDRIRAFVLSLTPTGGVLEQTVKSGLWMAAMNVLSRGFELIAIVVLARLLSPGDFGLYGIALLVVGGLNQVSRLGLDSALIQQKEENVDSYLNTMFGLQVGRGILVALLLVAAAPFVASVFGEPRATDIIRVTAISPVLFGLRNPGIVYFRKNLDFHMEFLYYMAGAVARFCVGVGFAIISKSVWALVFGLLAADVVKFVMSYLTHEYRPSLEFDVESARELVEYGKWITGNSALYFLYSEGDDAIVGWLLSTTALGFYQTAYRLSNAPATEITEVVSGVVFSMFSDLQESPTALRHAYYRTLQMTMFVSLPTAFGIAAVADVFVVTFMGQQWVEMVTVMQILVAYGLVRSIEKTMGPVWKAIDRPDYLTKLSAIRVIILALLIIPVTQQFGIEGTAVLITGVLVFPVLPIDIYLIVNSINGSYLRFARELAFPFAASLVMFGVVVTTKQRFSFASGVLEFVVLVGLGVVVYIAAAGLLATWCNWGIDKNLRSVVSAIA